MRARCQAVGAAVVVAAMLLTFTPAAPALATGASSATTVHLAHPKVVHHHLAVPATGPDDPALDAARALAGGGEVRAVSPDGRWLYAVLPDLQARRGLMRVVSVGDPRKPVVSHEMPLSPGLVPTDALVDEASGRLYVASGTHTLVLDIAAPGQPVVLGRIADVMIANHHGIELTTIADPTFGLRTFLSVTARWGRGEGCMTGTVHVLDISGRLQDAPIEIIQVDIPSVADGDGCPEPELQIAAAERRLDVVWHADDDGSTIAVDTAEYDITSRFQAEALACRLVRV